ncbi:trafficking protein particle complex subunit 9 [Marchantia polymorpha subsp. ruderalis]
MEPEASIESARMIRVAVVAVGNIPSAQLRDYVALVLRHRVVSLECARLFYKEHQKSPFAQQSWDTGSLCFKFLVGGAPRSPWEDFQANRKCLGVIGLMHCPTTPDIGAAYDHFMAICRAYPSAQEKRCFALYPTDGQVELDEKKRQHLVMFPPDRQMLEYHLQTLMQDFAASLLMAFESWVLHAEPVGAILTTPLDSQASLNSEEVSKAKKRRLGRVQKTIGDYCLLAGSPVDANAHYSTAIDLARLTGDLFWHAGAIEGSVSALVVDRGGLKDPQLEEEVRYRYLEVIQLYHRATAFSFELEATLKLARFLCRKELAGQVVELLMGAVEGSKTLMDASDRLVLNVEVARIFGALGYERKAAFYARQVAQLYQQQDSCWAAMSALQVLTLTAKSYRIQSKAAFSARTNTLMELLHEKDEPSRDSRGQYSSLEVGADGQWSTLQMDILGDMLAAAVRAGDPLSAWSAAARLVRGHYPLITPSAQFGLATALVTAAERLPPGTRCSDPALPFVRLHSYPRLPPELEVVKRFPGKKEWWVGASSVGPFIYTPFTSKGNESENSAEVIWVVGEPVQVLVDLSNPCAFEVYVESICLSVESGEIEAFPVSVVLPPNTSQVLSLSGLPLSVGSLVVRGCIVQCFGVVTEHLFEEAGELVSGVAISDPFRSVGGPRVSQSVAAVVEVMPPLPLLVAEVVGGEGAVVLYEGEIREMHIRLANAGVVPVLEATMTLTGKHKEHVLSLGHDILTAALPLFPGASVVVPVKLKAGQPTTEVEVVGSKGAGVNNVKPAKDPACPMLVIYYAGPPMETRDMKTKAVISPSLPPGRRLALPLQLHVLRGLYLQQARLLSMEVPAQISRYLPDPGACKSEATSPTSTLVKIDPYRGSWGLLLLELELWNATDVLFEITVTVNKGKESVDEELADDGMVNDSLYPSTRIDQNHSARVLIPLERFKLPGLEKAFLARSLAKKYGLTKHDSKARESSERQAKSELNATIEELSSRISVKWHSGRNSAGELPIKDAIREALQASAIEILLPDPLTFGFRLARDCRPSYGDKVKLSEDAVDEQPKSEDSEHVTVTNQGNNDSIVAQELTPIEMLVRNNTREAVTMSLSVTCRDVTGASCLGSSGAKATVLWAGALNGVDVEVPALGEVVHGFALCFLVPGQYTLLGAAVINDPDESLGPNSNLQYPESEPEPLYYSGPPYTVNVTGIS